MTPGPVREAAVARLAPLVGGWPADLLDPRRPVSVCRRQPDGTVVWYAAAATPRQARDLRETVLGFVGPSYSEFAGQPAVWDAADPVEAELLATVPHGFRLVVPRAHAAAVEPLFDRLRRLLTERPASNWVEPQPLGRLLRDFELLLRANDAPAAFALLDRLRDRGQLTTPQFAGLHLRALAAAGRWAEVLASPDLPPLLVQRLPARAAEAVAAAVHHEHLARWGTEAEAVAHFRERVAPQFGGLFRQRAGWTDPDALAAGRIADATTSPPAAHEKTDPAIAVRQLLPGPFTPESLRLLVEAALDCGTTDAAVVAVAAVRGCPAPVREQAFTRRTSRAVLEELEAVARAADGPADWLAWLVRAGQGGWPQAAEVAERSVHEWPRPDPSAFNAALAAHLTVALPSVRDALPAVLQMILPNGVPDPRLAPAYRLLLAGLVLDDHLSPATSGAVIELVSAVLRSAPIPHDYREVVDALELVWGLLKRPALLDWGLELLDVLAEHAVHRHTGVNRLVQDVAGEFARATRHVTPGQRALLAVLCGELDESAAADLLPPAAEVGAVDEAAVLRTRLGKRKVVLLTLHARTASAFCRLMADRYPDARVEVLREEAGSKRFQDLAGYADVFIVNTFDAKHAATNFLRQHRPSDAVTLYPNGKNAARQFDALEAWLRTA